MFALNNVFLKHCFSETPIKADAKAKEENHFVLNRNDSCFPETLFSRNTLKFAWIILDSSQNERIRVEIISYPP
jgi:hypothetical protein